MAGAGQPSSVRLGLLARDAPLPDSPPSLPVVLLSHGTGGAAIGLGWLARGLAARGYVVLGPNHHGNTAAEPYRAEGFACWWERARDLSVLLDKLSAAHPFAGRLDLNRIYAAGFSLGAYTVLSAAGARTDMDRFRAWSERARPPRGPAEFPDLADHIPQLLASSAQFRASWQAQGASFRDARVRAVLACAPPPPVRAFVTESLEAITTPVAMVATRGDREAPYDECALWLHQHLPDCTLTLLGPQLGHYAFLTEETDEARANLPAYARDVRGALRTRLHERVLGLALATFTA